MNQPQIALYLLTIIASIGLIFLVTRRAKLGRSMIYFVLFLSFTTGWLITLFLFYALTNETAVLWLGRLNFSFVTLATVFIVYSVLTFHSSHKLPKLFVAITAIETVTLAIIAAFTPWISAEEKIIGTSRITTYGPLYWWFISHFIGYSILFVGLTLWRLRELNKHQKLQLIYILGGVSLASIFGAITNIIVPLFTNNTDIQNLGPFAAFLIVGFTTYGLTRHKLFDIKAVSTEVLVVFLFLTGFGQLILAPNLQFFLIYLIILLLLIVAGILLIKSVVREHESAEKIRKLNKKLTSSNKRLEKLTTDLTEANRHLKELMKIKTEFLQIASHQLRTPLTSLRGLLEMQAEGNFDTLSEAERKKMQKDMLGAANNLNNIVNDLLDAMELEGGNLNFSWQEVDVVKQLKEAINTLKPSYDKKELSVTLNTSAEPLPKIKADPDYLRQVFLNIINNAEKYTENGGLTITPQLEEDKIKISFQDTGIGIEKEELSKLFGKFVRGKRSALVHTDGSGLGLFIIKKIVDEHGGSVTIESKGKDKGTNVCVTLPLRQANK